MNAHNRYCLNNPRTYTNWTNGGTQAQGVTISDEYSIAYVLAHPESISGLRALANSGRNYVEIFEDDPFLGTHWIEAVYCFGKRKQRNAEGEEGYSGEGPLFTVADWTNNGVGGLVTGMERTDGNFRLNNNSGFSPKFYTKPNTAGKIFSGGFGIKTYNTATLGNRFVTGSFLVSLGLGAYSINNANIADGRTFGYNTQVATAQVAGGMAGSWAGASIGASIGVWFGAVIGCVLGGWGGSELGGAAVDWYY